MAYFVNKERLKTNSGLAVQAKEITGLRVQDAFHMQDEIRILQRAGRQHEVLAANAAVFPAEFYTELDTITKEIMLDDDGFNLMMDIESLSKNVAIGKIINEYRRYKADNFEVRTSLDGQHAKPTNRGGADYDGTIIPVHTTGVGASWRELSGMRAAGFDTLFEDHRHAMRAIRLRMANQLFNGDPTLSFKGYKADGIKNSQNVQAFDINDLAGQTLLTGPNARLRDAFRAFINALLSNDNNAKGAITFYVSSQIWARMSEIYVGDDGSGAAVILGTTETVLDVLKRLPDVEDIKVDSNLDGDEVVGVIRRSEYIQPVVGMPLTTVPIERRHPMDEEQLLVWGAIGYQFKADAYGRSGILYASK